MASIMYLFERMLSNIVKGDMVTFQYRLFLVLFTIIKTVVNVCSTVD